MIAAVAPLWPRLRCMAFCPLWHLHKENEALGCSGCPMAHGPRRGARAERRVDLDRVKLLSVRREVIGRSQAPRVERAFPACSRERGGAEKNSCVLTA